MTGADRGLKGVTKDYIGLYTGLQGYKGLQELQGVTRATGADRGLQEVKVEEISNF